MTGAAWIAFAVAALAAVGDWVAVARAQKVLEYACKPVALAALVVAAAALHPSDGSTRTWFVVALVFSLAGDVFLMLPRDLFVFGLASFLVGHLAYIGGFVAHGLDGAAVVGAAVGLVVVSALLARRIISAVAATDRQMVGPVVVYILAIATMVTCALASGWALAAAGAALFYVSDATIAWNRFVSPKRWMPLAIIVTYHLGQAGLVLSLAR
jgi:uncharacterized membrane protein YhhN